MTYLRISSSRFYAPFFLPKTRESILNSLGNLQFLRDLQDRSRIMEVFLHLSSNVWYGITVQRCRKVKKFGGPVVISGDNLPSPGWNRVNWSAKYWGPGDPLAPPIPASLRWQRRPCTFRQAIPQQIHRDAFSKNPVWWWFLFIYSKQGNCIASLYCHWYTLK